MSLLIKKRQRPRRAVVSWMRRNPSWVREIIAFEWQRKTGEEWTKIMASSYHGA